VSAEAPPPTYPLKFRAAVVREIETLGLDLLSWRDDGIDVADPSGEQRFLSLANLYREISLQPPEETQDIVHRFIERVFVPSDDRPAELPETLDAGAERLMIRVGPPHADADNSPWSDFIPGVDDLVLSLVFDYPTMVAYVSKSMMADSSGTADQWVQQARLNLYNGTGEGWLQPAFPEMGIYAGNKQDSYDAARALVFHDLADKDEAGWLISLPSRDLLYARKVEPSGVPHFHMLKVLARDAVAKMPYPISDEVYWIRPSREWVKIRIDLEDERVNIYPPQELVDLLNIQIADVPAAPEAEPS
jgi:hypothetical protein